MLGRLGAVNIRWVLIAVRGFQGVTPGVLDFRPKRRRASHAALVAASHRSATRWLLLLGLVVILGPLAADGSAWQWLVARTTLPAASPVPRGMAALPPVAAFDPAPAGASDVDPARHRLPGLAGAALEVLRDDTVYLFSRDERLVLHHVFGRLAALDSAELQDRSWGQVAYEQLVSQPSAYRGDVVSLRGTLHRALRRPPMRTDFPLQAGLGALNAVAPLEPAISRSIVEPHYELWIRPEHGFLPVVVLAQELPEGFPEGDNLRQPVSVTGVFLKRWVFKAAGDVDEADWSSAPVLAARSFTWSPPPPAAPAAPRGAPSTAVAVLGSVLLLVVIVALLMARVARPVARFQVGGIAPVEEPVPEPAAVGAALRQLAEAVEAAEPPRGTSDGASAEVSR